MELARKQEYPSIIARGYLLMTNFYFYLGIFFLDPSCFDNAQTAYKEAKKIVESKGLSQEKLNLDRIEEKMKIYKDTYEKTMGLIQNEQRKNEELKKNEMEFLSLIDNYSIMIKKIFSSLG